MRKPFSATDRVRDGLRQAAEASGLTQQQIGEKMGFGPATARKAVSRLLNVGGKNAGKKSGQHDPRLSTLLKFADALGKPLRDLL
jgi:transcriptional regulator with XRE-family HTH domain